MSKIDLNPVATIVGINANFQKIEDELNNKVFYRDNPVGQPNTIQNDVDVNGKNLFNINQGYFDQIFIDGEDIETELEQAVEDATNAANSAAASKAAIDSALDTSPSSVALAANLANYSDPAKGAALVGFRGLTVSNTLDNNIDVRSLGVKGDGLLGSGAANLAALNLAVSTYGSGVYRFRRSIHGDNIFILSDSWNIVDLDNVQVFIEAGVIVKTLSPTTFGHVICFGAGPLLGGVRTDRVTNVGLTGGGSVISSGSSGADNSIGFLRCNNWYVEGMNIPTCDRKAITCQVNDAAGDTSKFNGNGWILNNKIGITGNAAISVEGGCDGTVFVDGNTCESAGQEFLHFAGSTTPDVSIGRVVLGRNVCKSASTKGLFAFKVLEIIDNGFICQQSTERGVDIQQCGDVNLHSRVRSTGSWGVRISSCTGDIVLGAGFKATTSAPSFSSLDLTGNARDALISGAIIGDGGGAYTISTTTKSAMVEGAVLTSGSSGLVNGIGLQGRLFIDGIYSEYLNNVRYKVPAGSVQFTSNSTTPDVSGGGVFKTSNSSPTMITNFLNGYDGQEITVVTNDTNTTIQDNANIKLAGSVNFVATSGNDTIKFVRTFGTWFETGRSDN